METITLKDPTLAAEIVALAQEQGQSADEFVQEAVRRHIAKHRQKRIRSETEAWYNLSSEIRQQYAGQYVAIYRQEIVDSSPERFPLFQRVQARFGRQPVAILSADDSVMPTYNISSGF